MTINQWNIEYANTITNRDRLNHHLSECNDSEIKAIKENLYQTPKGQELFDKATFGMGI